jgi:hypothetical protein
MSGDEQATDCTGRREACSLQDSRSFTFGGAEKNRLG